MMTWHWRHACIWCGSTVLVNGTSAKLVLEALGLLKMTPQQLNVLQHVLQVCVCVWGGGGA
jgi:hypothetical protein